MSAPRHLWSEDWEAESAAAAEALARLRAEAQPSAPVVEPTPERSPPPSPVRAEGVRAGASPRTHSRPRERRKWDWSRQRDWFRRWDWATFSLAVRRRWRSFIDLLRRDGIVRASLVAALIVVCLAGVSYAAASYVSGSGGPSGSASTVAPGWLGIEMAATSTGVANIQPTGVMTFGDGVLVTDVVPGSPAAVAGLEPGDLITRIAGVPVATPQEVDRVLLGLAAGDSVEVQYEQGHVAYATEVILGVRPAGAP